jgi:Skp family chaperone for outer membrane proteins
MKGMFAMRSVVTAVSVCSLALVLSAAPGYAQAAAPAQPPAAQAQPAPAPQPPPPFPQGAKVGLVNLQQIASLSIEGKASTAKVQALITKKQSEAAAKAKQLSDNQAKLQTGGALLNDIARAQLEKDIERQTVESDRFQQDAQAEITEMQTQLQGEFQQRLFPVLNQLVQEKGLHILLSAADAGVIIADPAIDLTLEAIKRFDAASSTAKPAAPAAPTAKPAAPTTTPAPKP